MADVNKLNQKNIIQALQKNKEILKEFGVKKIALFGSYVKNNQKTSSDIDILVSMKKPTFDSYMDCKLFLEDLFHRKVDLVLEDNLKPALAYILQEAQYAEV
ncbi:MAG: nucleotidyltransferase family protein [Nanoarchaeota archaeon]